MNNVNPHQYLQDADLLYSEQEVLRAIHTLAKAITAHYENECPIVLSVMNGALVFAGQLIPNLAFPLQLDYIHATRYQGDVEGKNVTWLARPSINVKDRHVLILDDILDKGVTLKAIVDDCYLNGAKEIKTAVLLEKKLREAKPVNADFTGLAVPDRYVFGCGMDIHGLWRNLPAIYALKE